MAKDTVHSHQFDRRISIQSITAYTDDAQGGQIPTWKTVYTCWADVQDYPHARGLKRSFFAQQNYPVTSTIIAIRWQPAIKIDASMRILHIRNNVTHILKILDGSVFNESNVLIYIAAQEDQAKGVN